MAAIAKRFQYLVVGGGNAAGYVCKEFAAAGVGTGKVGVICAEQVAPYERPALTKAYLHPPSAKVRARLPGFHTCVGGGGERQTPEWYSEKGIELVKGRAQGLKLDEKIVEVGGGISYAYDKLIIATGVQPLRLSEFGVKGDELSGVHYLREEAEAAALVADMEALQGSGNGRVVIVGGGFIGLECAAALVGWGADVTVVFPESHIMSRFFDAKLAEWLEKQCVDRGIKFVKGDSAVAFNEGSSSGKVGSVSLKSGSSLPADVVVIGVGAKSNTEWLKDLELANGGIKVNGFMQTSNKDVFAVGDIAAFPEANTGKLCREEHVAHARLSASMAAKSALGLDTSGAPYQYLPYLYSRLFEYTEKPIVFNFFGAHAGAECHVRNISDQSVAAVWAANGKVVGALVMGSPGPSADESAMLRGFVESQPAASCPASAADLLVSKF